MLQRGSGKRYDPKVIDIFLDVIGKPREETGRFRELPASELMPGMVSGKDILSSDGTLLLAADYVLDAIIVRQIQTYATREGIHLMVSIRTDKRFNTAPQTASQP